MAVGGRHLILQMRFMCGKIVVREHYFVVVRWLEYAVLFMKITTRRWKNKTKAVEKFNMRIL